VTVLVFTRRRDETIIIGNGIEVRVLRIGKDGVRLGVTAPPEVPVHRREVYDLIREENRRAAGSVASSRHPVTSTGDGHGHRD
jgi:carbon storage regulator